MKHDFYIDESPNGERYFIDNTIVSQKEFLATAIHGGHAVPAKCRLCISGA